MIRERKPNRLPGYNYSRPGAYFVTINVYNRENVFGEIRNGLMILNELGRIAQKKWQELPDHFNYCRLDEFILMPDHFHGIIILGDGVGNRHACSLHHRHHRRQYQSLPVIVGSYKSSVSKSIHQCGKTDFRWQKSYWDRIIRDELELNRIRQYIINNPLRGRPL